MAEAPSFSIAVQRSENTRKNSFLNYESPALTAELQAQFALDLIMRMAVDQPRNYSGAYAQQRHLLRHRKFTVRIKLFPFAKAKITRLI